MPRTRMAHYLRTHRLRLGLSQAELDTVLGFRDSAVSKYERQRRPRSLRLLIAVHIVFGTGPEEMFPELYAEIARQVLKGAAALDAELAKRFDETSLRKRRLIGDLIERASAKSNHV